MRSKLNSIILACLLLLLGFANPGEARRIHLAVAAQSMAQIAHYVAKEKGYYDEEGLDVQLVVMSAPVAALAVIGGNVEFGGVGGALLPAILSGAPIRFVFSAFYRPMYWLYAKPDIRDIKGLRGKRVAVSGIGSGPATLLLEVLKRNGLEGGRDVIIAGLGTQPNLFSALLGGAIDAGILIPPFIFKAEEAGFRELVSFMKQDFVELQGSILLREELLQSDPVLVEKFIRGTIKGFRYARDSRSGTIPILARHTKVSETVAAKDYDLARQGMAPDGTVGEELQRKFLEPGLKRLGLKDSPPLDRIFNFTLARKVNAELDLTVWKPGP